MSLHDQLLLTRSRSKFTNSFAGYSFSVMGKNETETIWQFLLSATMLLIKSRQIFDHFISDMLSSSIMLKRNEVILGVNSGLCLEHSWLWLFTEYRGLRSRHPLQREYLPKVQGVTEAKKRLERLSTTFERLFQTVGSSKLLWAIPRRCCAWVHNAQRVPISSRRSEQN